MSTILLVGVGPMPAPRLERVYAPGLRLNSYARALIEAGHRVFIGELSFGGPQANLFQSLPEAAGHREIGPGVEKASLDLSHWARSCDPQAIIALTDVGALAAAQSDFAGPLYVDYNGHQMAERQQQGAVHNNDEALAQAWLAILPVLLRADKFSVCSVHQRLALIGELGAAGRLNSLTSGYDFVDVVQPSLPTETPHGVCDPKIRLKYNLPEHAPLILYTGGYNTWVDADTLFEGVEAALRQEPAFHFVTTGGAIQGHVNVVFDRFLDRVLQSGVSDRIHFLGWIPHADLFDLMQTAVVAVNADLPVYEGELGFRNRLLDWVWAGLRVVTTVTSNPAAELVRRNLARQVPVQDPQALAFALVEETHRGRVSQADADEWRRELLQRFGRARNLQPVLEWAAAPTAAPDQAQLQAEGNPLVQLQRRFLALAHKETLDHSVRRRAREASQRLLGSSMIQVYLKMNPEVRRTLEDLGKL